MFKVNNKDARRSGVFTVNFEHISHLNQSVKIGKDDRCDQFRVSQLGAKFFLKQLDNRTML